MRGPPRAVPHSPEYPDRVRCPRWGPNLLAGPPSRMDLGTDREQQMTDEQLRRLGAFADEAAIVLYREMLLLDLDRSRERELLRDILSPDENPTRGRLAAG